MNRKNLTAALLAGLAGAAGIAGSAQAVNLNPDGIGSVLIYPYYTVNGGNDTLLSVVNTTDEAKAVKVRFLEAYNSREVLDFNLYMSAYDVWTAAIVAGQSAEDEIVGVPAGEDGAWLITNDTSCTVPYLYESGPQAFLPYAYSQGNEDGGPTDLWRTREGHAEMIEMGTLVGASAVDATHTVANMGMPADCQQLVDNWSTGGIWLTEALANVADPDDDFDGCQWSASGGYWCDYATTDTERNSGGLFGSGAIINGADGTLFSYDAKAIQGVDDKDRGNHHVPGTSRPSLNHGNQNTAYVFFGEPITKAVALEYPQGVDAISAVFMHELIMNEYSVNPSVGAKSEWVVTFPTKNWYVDDFTRDVIPDFFIPNPADPGCGGWNPATDPVPNCGQGRFPNYDEGQCPSLVLVDNGLADDWPGGLACSELAVDLEGQKPFTSTFNGTACEWFEVVDVWDREESPSVTQGSGPIVSPPPPGGTPPGSSYICYETNVIRWSTDPTPDEGTEIFGSPAEKTITLAPGRDWEGNPAKSGWAMLNFWDPSTAYPVAGGIYEHIDYQGLVGLPVTGFWALAVVNAFVGEDNVLANYGGLFGHKANIRRDGKCWTRYGNFCGSSFYFE